ncbi:MAG TPA: hypothetical protein VHG33_00940 [Woeseiaceae bacterium]|nr:hypothetical protein [Woeseiaceae bacterium]
MSDHALRSALAWGTASPAWRRALLCEATRRVCGTSPSATDQRLAVELLEGRAVEAPQRGRLETVVGLVAGHLALEGRSCHVLSFTRTAISVGEALGEFLDFAGIGWGCLESADPAPRRADLYRRPVLFATAQDISLDLLRERVKGGPNAVRIHGLPHPSAGPVGPRLLAALDFALVLDGATTLCRKALTTAVGTASDGAATADALIPEQAFGIAAQMQQGSDFQLEKHRVALTRQGRERLRVLSACLGPAWENPTVAEFALCHALEALHLWHRGTHYSVADNAVTLDDPALRARGQNAGQGLHPEAFIALKEGIGDGRGTDRVDRISIRTAIQKYPNRASFVADLQLNGRELREAYGLHPRRIARPRPPDAVCLELADLPALIGTSGEPALPVIVGGTADVASAVARSLAPAVRLREPIGDDLEAAAARAGVERIEDCLWMQHCDADTGYLALAGGRGVVLIAAGNRWFPEVPDGLAVQRVQIADARLLGHSLPRWLRMVGWFARTSLPGAGNAFALAIHAHCVDKSRAEAEMRRRLHEFDRACRRVVSFLSPKDEWN